MAEWVDLFGRRFRNGICENDKMYCSSCHYQINPDVQRFVVNGIKMGRATTPDFCPSCGADMQKPQKKETC